jgi:G:T-mismatch repair DNA endonuclease (very short patch repair protein)
VRLLKTTSILFILEILNNTLFVDSEFFHGKDWETQKDRVKTNTEFWQKKIERNRLRDVEVNNYLESQNWKVIRFWSHEIEKKSGELYCHNPTRNRFATKIRISAKRTLS